MILTWVGGVGFSVHAGRCRTVGLFVVAQVLGWLGSLFHASRDPGGGVLLIVRTTGSVVMVVPVRGPLGRARRRRSPLMVAKRFVGTGCRWLWTLMMMVVGVVMGFRLVGRRQTVVCWRRSVVVTTGAAAVAVIRLQQRILAATGHLVLHEPTYVRQQEHSLTLAARQQVHLIGTAGALCRVRIRCEKKGKLFVRICAIFMVRCS